jgi:hypothetical protein
MTIEFFWLYYIYRLYERMRLIDRDRRSITVICNYVISGCELNTPMWYTSLCDKAKPVFKPRPTWTDLMKAENLDSQKDMDDTSFSGSTRKTRIRRKKNVPWE